MFRYSGYAEAEENAVDHFDVFACQRCILLSSKRTKSIFGLGSAPHPAGAAYDAPSDLLAEWRGRCPLPIPCPDLGVLKSVPNFYHRFMVTLNEVYFAEWKMRKSHELEYPVYLQTPAHP